MNKSYLSKLLLPLVLLVTFAAPLWATPLCTDQPSGLVSWWRAEGNADDQLGANNGSVQGSGLAYAAGKVGQAFSMNGDGYVQLPAVAGSRSQGTVMLWVNYNSIQDSNQPFGSAEYNFTLLNLKTGYNGVFIFGIQLDYPIGWQYALSSVTPSTGQWYHVAGTWGPEDIKIYVNGELSVNADYTSSSYTGSSVATAYNLIGRFIRDGYPSSTVDGLIDEVALFDRALSASEIAAIYNSDSAGMCIDSTPDAFSFIDQTNMPLSTEIIANPITVGGIVAPAEVSVTGGEYALSTDGGSTWGAWTSTPDNVSLNTRVMLRLTSSASYETTDNATLTIGGVSDTFSVTTAAAGDPNASGLVSWWKAEGNAYDSIGGNHGILEGSATFATGKAGQAFDLSSAGDYVSIPDSANLAITDNITVAGWFYPRAFSHGQSIFNRRNASNEGGFDLELAHYASYSNTIGFYIYTSGGWQMLFAPNETITNATWYHVAGTYNNSMMRLYINGVEVSSLPVSGAINNPLSPSVRIGSNIPDPSYHFNGLIDELKVYNRALSAGEVAQLICMVPDAFNFIDQSGMPLNTGIISNPITITGITCSATIAIVGGQYALSTDSGATWGDWTGTGGTVSLNDQVKVRLTSSASYATQTSAALTIGGFCDTFSVTTAAAGDPKASGLISWWKGDGNALDSVGGNHGTSMNGAAYTAGMVNQSFSFDGSDDYILFSTMFPFHQATDATLEFWVRSRVPSGHGSIFWTRGDSSDANRFNIAVGNGTFYFDYRTPSGELHNLVSTALPYDTWTHIAVTRAGNTYALYKDGIFIMQTTDASPSLPTATTWMMSGRSGYIFNGLLDEVKVFNCALTAGQVGKLSGIVPDAFSFIDQTGMPLNTAIVSNPITITGISYPAAISIAGDSGNAYRINSDNWTTAGGTVGPGDTVMVRVTSSSADNAATNATLTIGGVNDTFSVTTAAAGDPNATSGLVSWWKAENNALDSVGGNHGTLQGGATFATGQSGKAFSLDGIDDHVKVHASSSLDVGLSDGFSISAWINPHDISQQQPLLEWNTGSSWGSHFWISVPVSGGGSGSLFANILDASGNDHYFSSATNILTANTYQHVALTYDKNTGLASLYANGAVAASQNLGIFVPQTSYDLFIAFRPNIQIIYFNGLIDEVKIYNRALSAAEIATLVDTTPVAFSFTDQPDVARYATIESNAITVTGIDAPAAISITGGEYAVSTDGGSTWGGWATAGTVSLNNMVKIHQTSSTAYADTTNAILTIGGVSGTFSITTLTAPDVFSDNFTSGISPAHWTVNAGAYTIDSTQGDIRMSKPAGGGAWGSVILNHTVDGDFDISVEYRDANITHVTGGCWSGNQIQLNLVFGGQGVSLVRGDECSSGNNYHVWADPPASVYGTIGTTDLAGKLRITRIGSSVTFYANDTILWQPTLNDAPLTHISLSLQNNNTEDAISVTFDNFLIMASDIVIPDAFNFINQTGMPLSTAIVSNPITVTGINSTAPISITGGDYSISTDGGSTWGGWTTAGVVSLDNKVKVRVNSSPDYNATTEATLAISGVSDTFSVTTASATNPNATGLVAWWKAEGNALDSVGGNHGSLQGGAGFAAGQIAQAFSFDGTDDYVSIAHNDNLNPTAEQTLEFWLYFNSLPSDYKDLIQKGIGGSRTQYYVRTNDSNDLEFATCLANHCYSMAPYTGNALSYAALGITAGNWYHIAFTVHDSAQIAYVYVNGVQKGSTSGYAASYPENTGELTLGGFSWDGYFPGRLDEIKIFNRALSAGEVGKLSGMVPDAFTFTEQTGVALSTIFESNAITVTGTRYPTAISITGADGQYAVSTDNGSTWGSWTNTEGEVSPGSKVKVHVTSSASYATTVDTTLTIGGVSDTFSVTTGPAPVSSTTTIAASSTTTMAASSTTTSVARSTTTTIAASTTTTVAVSTTTTTSTKCPVARASYNPAQTKSLRELRDRLLDSTLGAMLSSLYYQNLDEVADILQANDELGSRFTLLVRCTMPVVKGLMQSGSAAMPGEDMLEVYEFLLDLQAHAGPRLRMDIDFILRGIESGWLLGWSGITVE